MSAPKVDKISELLTAFKLSSARRGGSCRRQHSAYALDTPHLASWDSLDWYEIVQEWELRDFLVSGTAEANLLMRSLQSCLQWYEKADIDEVLEIMRIIN